MDPLIQEALDTATRAEQIANAAQAAAGITLTAIAPLPGGGPNRVAIASPGVKATALVVPLRNVPVVTANITDLGDLTAAPDALNGQVIVTSSNALDLSRVQALVFNH